MSAALALILAAFLLSTVAILIAWRARRARAAFVSQLTTAVAGTVLLAGIELAHGGYPITVLVSSLDGAAWLLTASRWAELPEQRRLDEQGDRLVATLHHMARER